jgi:hypothetical protein
MNRRRRAQAGELRLERRKLEFGRRPGILESLACLGGPFLLKAMQSVDDAGRNVHAFCSQLDRAP